MESAPSHRRDAELSALGSWERTCADAPPAETAELGELGEDQTSLGRYRVLRRIGVGAMGVVYEGYDAQLDRRVALKVLRAEAAAQDALNARSRMMREARALARLRHAHVTTIYEVGTSDEGVPFIAMELVEGRTLERWLRSRPRSWREIVAVFLQAGQGLAAAHEAGLVHRDFKPANVIIDERGQARVVDFGLARTAGLADLLPTLDESEEQPTPLQLTCTGAVLGTPAYMAPEQFEGSAVGSSSDQFSFCVALFEALYRRRPFPGHDMRSLRLSLLRGTPVGPRRGVPRALHRVLRRGLSVDAAERFPSMRALLGALEACAGRRRPSRSWLLVAGLLVAAGVGAWLAPIAAHDASEATHTGSPSPASSPASVVARAAGPIWDR